MSQDERNYLLDLAGTVGTNSGSLTIGQLAIGNIANVGGPFGDHDYYFFKTQPGTTYQITAVPATWPSVAAFPNSYPYFVVRTASGALIDQAALDRGVQIYQFSASTYGTYYVDAQGYFSNSVGGYSLLLTSNAGDDVGGSFPTRLSPNVQFDGQLEQVGDSDTFAVSLTAGNAYFLAIRAPTLSDAFVRVLTPAWTELSSADQGSGFQTSFVASATGDFYLDISSNSLLQTGSYSIFYQQRLAPTLTLAVGTTLGDTFALGAVVGSEVWGWDGNDIISTGRGNDAISGGEGNDSILTGAGDDLMSGDAGNDLLDGGAGLDGAGYAFSRASYQVAKIGSQFRIADRSGVEGTDTLVSIEFISFQDGRFGLVNPPPNRTPVFGGDSGFLFDGVYYLLANPNLSPSVTMSGALQHYLSIGASQGRAPNSWFDASYYERRWPDLTPLNLDDATLFQHYNLFGVWEGRSAGPKFERFDGNRYLADNPDVAGYVDANLPAFLGSRSNGAIAHFIIYGANEQRVSYDSAGTQIDMGYVL